MLPFAHVMDFFANKFSGLGAGRFAFLRVLPRASHGFLVRHFLLLLKKYSPLVASLAMVITANQSAIIGKATKYLMGK